LKSNIFDQQTKILFILNGVRSGVEIPQSDIRGFLDIKYFFNCALIVQSDQLQIYSYNPFNNHLMMLQDSPLIHEIFPEKLKNLHGYRYQLLLTDQQPNIFVGRISRRMQGTEAFFMVHLLRQQNASLVVKKYMRYEDFRANFEKIMENNTELVTFNVGIKSDDNNLERVPNFQAIGFCVLVPFQSAKSFLDDILSPYQSAVWVGFLITIFSAAVVWRFIHARLRRTNSTWDFLFNIFGMFLLQGPQLPRMHRLQKLMLQTFVFETFILGTAYQSQIIDLMFSARNTMTIDSVESLMKSDLNLAVQRELLGYYDLGRFNQSKAMLLDLRASKSFGEFTANNTALIMRCDMVNVLRKTLPKTLKKFYTLKEKIEETIDHYTFSKRNPFKNEIKRHISGYFESGLRQYWKRFYETAIETPAYWLELQESDFYLQFLDVQGAFFILIGGLVIALFVFILEVIHYRAKRSKIFAEFKFWKLRMKLRLRLKKNSVHSLKTFQLPQRMQRTKKTTQFKPKKLIMIFNKMRTRKVELANKILTVKFSSLDSRRKCEMKFRRSGIVAFYKKQDVIVTDL
jgi:hypothetical protein